MSVAPAPSAEAPNSIRRKILRRTLSGGGLVLGVAALFVWNEHDGAGRPLAWVTAIVAILALVEAGRMGRIARADVGAPLLVGGFAALALATRAREQGWEQAELGASGWLALAGTAALAALAAHLAARALERLARVRLVARWISLALVAALVAWGLTDRTAAAEAALAAALVCAISAPFALQRAGAFGDAAWAATLPAWIAPPVLALYAVWSGYGALGLVALLAISKIGDTAAYYVGSAIGRTHPFPRLSPGKTTAGCVASFVAAVALAAVLHATDVLPAGRFGLAGALLAGATLNLAAQSGDLLESWVKRRALVKDSSTWFGPSGGLLDQLDSLMLSVPMAACTWPWLFPL